MRNLFRRFLPSHELVENHRWLRPFGSWLHHPNLWHLNRRSVAGGLAAGMFCGLIPGPLQMASAAVMAVFFRVNLPVALITTLYTNPFTILPLYVAAYEIGGFLSGVHNGAAVIKPPFPELHWQTFMSELSGWMVQLGEPLLIGLPVLATGLAFLGYVVVRVAWRVAVILRWRARARHRVSTV